jgi:hypothetical protein
MSSHEQYSDIPRGQVIGSYDTYLEAQRAVDYLSDNQFPVENVTIVGSDLQMVERITGRLTRGRAVLGGAASGAWFGLFVGTLLGLFSDSGTSFVVLLLSGVAYGAIFGAVFGLIGYAATGGRRDFTSNSQIVARRYEVLCHHQHADGARDLLARLSLQG